MVRLMEWYLASRRLKPASLNTAPPWSPPLSPGISQGCDDTSCRNLFRTSEGNVKSEYVMHGGTGCKVLLTEKYSWPEEATPRERPRAYLDPNRQLIAGPSIRFHFDEVHGRHLTTLHNISVLEI
jgi:hypothetical protein